MIRTNIEYTAAPLAKFQVLMIGSAEMSDGKSTVSANLAITWADLGKRVLLIDADLRRSTVDKTFQVPNGQGLTGVLADQLSAEQVIQPTIVAGLDVLTAGPVPPNPADLLESPQLAAILNDLRQKYDLIIIDVPPFTVVTDAQVILPHVDGVVLIVTLGKTWRSNMQRAVASLKISQANLLGVVTRSMQAHRRNEGYYKEEAYAANTKTKRRAR
nr:CpsD/CapB family tyrosine-protein kinase [Weissella diestrammenae]